MSINSFDLRDEQGEQRGHLVKELLSIPLDDCDPTWKVQIRSQLEEGSCNRLLTFLRTDIDVFTWIAFDMSSIDPKVMVHQLHVDPSHKFMKQKK